MNGDTRSTAAVVGALHAWFETTRVDGGYGGPVSHWWRDSLRYAGPGLDWRYEGLVHGYLNLYATTGDERWLDVATTAGRDLVSGQLQTGNYRASAFERNPEFGGTPHEACASGALVRLARVARDADREWEPFATTASRNLQWHLDALWRDGPETFTDAVGLDSYVPNKIASTAHAVLDLGRLTGEDALVDQAVRPAMETVLDLQVDSGQYSGAIHQLATGSADAAHGDGKFFPLYVARCVPPLLAVGDETGEDRFVDAAARAGEFLKQVERADGSFPQVLYETGHRNVHPRWVAGVGDVLRAYRALNDRGAGLDPQPTETWLLQGFDDCGAFRTARGFGRVRGRGEGDTLRDALHVVGWNDKAFRWLTTRVDDVTTVDPGTSRTRCTFDGTPGRFVESPNRTEFVAAGRSGRTYRWDKDSRWADAP